MPSSICTPGMLYTGILSRVTFLSIASAGKFHWLCHIRKESKPVVFKVRLSWKYLNINIYKYKCVYYSKYISFCRLKVADFGLARTLCPKRRNPEYCKDEVENETLLTDYVATRWYRAPEILVASRKWVMPMPIRSIAAALSLFLLLSNYVDIQKVLTCGAWAAFLARWYARSRFSRVPAPSIR